MKSKLNRSYLTDDEQDTFGRASEQFLRALALAAANALLDFPADVRMEVQRRLQEMTSLYSPFTSDLIDDLVSSSEAYYGEAP